MERHDEHPIPNAFITYAAEILGDSSSGLTGSQIVKYCSDYSLDYAVKIPWDTYPFAARNKRTALQENLRAFNSNQQYVIIRDLCGLDRFNNSLKVKDLKIKLITRYGHLANIGVKTVINEILIAETKHWLARYPESLSLYNEALVKYHNRVFQRNLLDDLRLSLEKLLKSILANDKTLENQIKDLGRHLKSKGGSGELTNMFLKLIEYYCSYQNTYVKHNDSVIEVEIEFVFEITSSFMKHIIKLS